MVAEPDREVRLRPGAQSRRSHGAFTHQAAELETHPRGHPTRNRSRPELLVTTPPHSVPADEPKMRNVTVRPAWRQGARAPGRDQGVSYGHDVVNLPLWAVFVVSFGSPLLAFSGVLVAQWIGRRGAIRAGDQEIGRAHV